MFFGGSAENLRLEIPCYLLSAYFGDSFKSTGKKSGPGNVCKLYIKAIRSPTKIVGETLGLYRFFVFCVGCFWFLDMFLLWTSQK